MFKRSSIIIASVFLAGLAVAEEPATAIIATQMGDALVVRGDDGKDHVEYDLLITSVFDGPVTLTSAEVRDEAGKVIGRIEGDGLKAAAQSLLTQQPVAPIPPSGAIALEIDLILEAGQTPKTLSHRLAYSVSGKDHAAPMLGSREVIGPQVAVRDFAPVTILSPLKGPGGDAATIDVAPKSRRVERGYPLAGNIASFR